MAKSRKPLSSNQRLARLFSPYWKAILVALVCLLGLTAVNLATPMLVGMVFNEVFPQRDFNLLWTILGALMALFILRNLFFYQSKFTAVRIGENVSFQLRKELYERLQQLRLSYTRSQSPGKLTSKVMNDSFQIQQFIQEVLPKFLQAALLFAGIVLTIYYLNWQLALAATFVLPFHFASFRFFGSRIKGKSRESQENLDFATGSVVETMLGAEVVKGFVGEERGNAAFRRAMENTRSSQVSGHHYAVLQKVSADLLIGLGMLALIAVGAYQVMGQPKDEAMQAGDFIAFFWYIKLLYPSVLDIMSSGAKLSKVGACVERAFELLNVRDEEPLGGYLDLPEVRGDISFKNVNFAFEDGNPALKDISFEIRSGEVCAITGHSGSGKTTLVSLLPLLLEPTAGEITVDGREIRELKLKQLRESIGVVFQECFLFNATILENLRYARPKATGSEIQAICRKTGADDFIRLLPNGYETIVGENGVSLSRGQKQLVTISRAILKDPKILILDEATASLDVPKETRVIPTILELMRGRTTLMITHSPELLKHADVELHLEEGRLVSFQRLSSAPRRRKTPPKTGLTGPAGALLLGASLLSGLFLPDPDAALHAQDNGKEEFRLTELESTRIRLSHISADRCLEILKIYGYTVNSQGKTADPGNLPIVVNLPGTKAHETVRDFDQSFPMTDGDPLNELLVLSNPDEPKQLSRLIRLIREDIDVPARQVMIEAMVLEISESGLERLGVDWQLADAGSRIDLLEIGDAGSPPDPLEDQFLLGAPSVFGEFEVNLRALLTRDEAEILSRPSVLTLDNRMAFINVAREIPIAQTKFQGNQNISTVNFRDKTVGIQLAVRPRIDSVGQEVNMQVNATVSAVVPGEDVEVRDSGGNVAATSPTISIREVKTYARIHNNTPFIIGGLISRDDFQERRTVPLLGEIPILGRAFGSTQSDRLRREVIIVITPYVLPDEDSTEDEYALQQSIGRFLPKGEDIFDSFGNRLYRDAYRIRDDDVFELDFLTRDEQLRRYQKLAERAVSKNYNLRKEYPFSEFIDGRIPGEQILVYRQMYEVIKRTGLDNKVDPERSILFEQTGATEEEFEVTFIPHLLRQQAKALAEDPAAVSKREDVWETLQNNNRAVAFTFNDTGEDDAVADALRQPVPDIRTIEVPDSETFQNKLWELNQPTGDGKERSTILLQSEEDLTRLRRALVLRDTVRLNASERSLTLKNFSVGRFLLLPTRTDDKVDLIDGRVAELFFFTERYYDAVREHLREASRALGKELEKRGLKDEKAKTGGKSRPQTRPQQGKRR